MAKETSGSGSSSRKFEVRLRVYDLSGGLAKQMSMAFLGKQVDGIWHTGVTVHGKEIFYGGGIQLLPPAVVEASFGIRPVEELVLGHTTVEHSVLLEFLRGVSHRFTAETYDLFRHNCNNFSNEVSQFLLGKGIPSHIIDLPNQVLQTPLGRMIAPMVTQMQNNMYGSVAGAGGDPFAMLASPAAATPSAVAAPPPLPPVAAPGTGAGAAAAVRVLAPEEPSTLLTTANRPFVSADVAVLPKVVTRLLARGAVSADEEAVLREGVARLSAPSATPASAAPAAGDAGAGGGAGAGAAGGSTSADAFAVLVARIAVAVDKTAAPALCLLKAALLDDTVLHFLTSDATTALEALAKNLCSNAYTTVTPRLMSLACFANLVAKPAGLEYLLKREGVLGELVDRAVQALSAERPQVRQMAAALLHNFAFALPIAEDGELSDTLIQIVCSVSEALPADTDEEAKKRRLLTTGRVIARAGAPAASLLEAVGTLEVLEGVRRSSVQPKAVRALASEVVLALREALPAEDLDDDEEEEEEE